MVRLVHVLRFVALMLFAQAGIVHAEDRLVRLALPPELAETKFPQFLLPRFTLKTQVKVQVVGPGDPAEAQIGTMGQAVFSGMGQTWHLQVLNRDHPGTARFADWITSDAGQRAITGFKPDGVQIFDLPMKADAKTQAVVIDGDAARGLVLSEQMCQRCHAIGGEGRRNAVDSTPSFSVLRSLSDWQERFETFYVLNPHPAFTQVSGVTAPFAKERPATIIPLEMTLEDVDAILAYVAAMSPADLGAPLAHQ